MNLTAAHAAGLNRAAFLEGDSDTPAIVVAGVAVHAYVDVEDARFVVSVHLDTGEVPNELVSARETVPLRITVNGTAIYDAD
ncbi:hypothetical protein ABZ864_40230 [Streptomyces sp. NPDC047082]|uniref:hypothetical protein n=1 Tax=Streptomyces sp. NPDC047082 TaxID=3155259 RepID=UPI00340284FD